MNKKIGTLIIVICTILSLNACGKKVDNPSTDAVTRGEWIAMLADGFGLESYQAETPYYLDVTTASEWFPVVQATAQWGILSIYSGDQLTPNNPVTYEEVASTAAIAAGFRTTNSQEDETGIFDPQPSIDYATQYGIVSPGLDIDRSMTLSECEAALAAAQAVYIEHPGEEKMIVVLNPELVDLSGIPLGITQITGNIVSFPSVTVEEWGQDATGSQTVTLRTNDGMQTIGVGTTFIIAPDGQAPFGVAYKVAHLETMADGGISLTTTTPALGDMYDDVDIHTTVSLEDSYITWADGVTVTSTADQLSDTGQSYHIELLALSSGQSQEVVSNRSSLSFSFTLPNWITKLARIGTANTMPDGEAREVLQNTNFVYSDSPSIEDFGGSTKSWTKKLTKERKYDKDYKIEGKIDMDIQVTAEVEYHKLLDYDLWPKAADLSIQSDITASLNYEGELTGEFEIGKISIPLGLSGFSVDGKLLLYAEANGSVNLKVELINDCRTSWQNPYGFREPYIGRKEVNPENEAALDLSTGVGVGLSLNAFTIKIIGTDLKVCGDLEVTGAIVGNCQEETQEDTTRRTYTEAFKVTSDFYVPIISVTVSGPDGLSDIFDIEKKFELFGKSKAQKKTILNKEYVFWTQTVELDAQGNIITPPGPLNGDFSEFSGTYRAVNSFVDMYGGEYPDLILHEDGTITGGGFIFGWGFEYNFAGTAPISVVMIEEPGSWPEPGTYECTVAVASSPTENGEYYFLFPAGVARYEGEDTSQVGLEYTVIDGGVANMYYTKID